MSTKQIDTPLGPALFDHGAQYFTARDPDFCKQVETWAAEGVVAHWPLPNPAAWVGTPGMSAVIKAMASHHQVHWNVHVDRIERRADGWCVGADKAIFSGFDALVLAIPPEQALPFLALYDFSMAQEAMLTHSQPCWTGLFTFFEPLPGNQDILRDIGDISWASRNAAKPGRSGPEGWVVQANPKWSQAHIADAPEAILEHLLMQLALAHTVDLPAPAAAVAHRWRYARSAGLGRGSLWNARMRLGVCADWLVGPRVECAWLSGQHLARSIIEGQAALPPGR